MYFDFTPYRFTIDSDEKFDWHMDIPHIQVLYGLAMLPGLRHVVEIGSFRGASTAAFVQAVKDGAGFHLHIVEIRPRPQLLAVLNQIPEERWSLHTDPIQDLDLPSPDLVLIDGDHGAPALMDVLMALCLRSRIIMMHDSQTHVTVTDKNHWGAHQAAEILKRHKEREWWEDCAHRPGMLTERGLFVSWPKSMDGIRERLEQTGL